MQTCCQCEVREIMLLEWCSSLSSPSSVSCHWRNKLVFQGFCTAKRERPALYSSWPDVVQDGHTKLHWNEPLYRSPFHLGCQHPCDLVRVHFICEHHTAILIEEQWRWPSCKICACRERIWLLVIKRNSAQAIQYPRECPRLAIMELSAMCMIPIHHILGR